MPSELVVARSFAFKRQRNPLLSYPLLNQCCSRQFDQFAYVPSQGASGGLITIWKSSLFTGNVVFSSDFALVITFTSMLSSHSWTLVNVYGPYSGDARVTFTNCLYDLDIPSEGVLD